jgi:hypothetical protein
MIALSVVLNGKQLCIAGAEDLAVLSAHVTAGGKLGTLSKDIRGEPPDLYIHVGGLTGRTSGDDEHYRWAERTDLKIGDEITIRLLETQEVDDPCEKQLQDRQRHEEKHREDYEDAKAFYFQFEKFEPAEG